jgi:osmoprotectant transport system substrate-binding protein
MKRISPPTCVLNLCFTLLLAAGLLSACGASPAKPLIRIGSKQFAEQEILAEMYAELLEDKGFPVERRLNAGIGTTLHAALLNNEMDLYPEYTGTALQQILNLPSSSDAEQVYQTVARIYKEKFNLIWLDPSPMNNTFALAVTQDTASRYGLHTLADLANTTDLTMIGPLDFDTRLDGLTGLQQTYGDFALRRYISVDSTIRYKGLIDGQADIVVAYTTDGEISAYNLVLLDDSRHFFPPYNVAPVIRQPVLDASGEIVGILNALAPHLTNAAMQRLNYEVSGKNRGSAEAAREFLLQAGLLKGSD